MSDELRLLAAFCLALIAARATVPLAIRLAVRTAFLDNPAGHKGHIRPTPYLGGAAVIAAFLVPALAFGGGAAGTAPIVLCTLVLLAAGTLDDRIGIGPLPRVLLEVAAGSALWSAGLGWDVFGGGGADLLLTIFWVVGLVNAFNLMDNMDGATGSLAAVSATGLALLAVTQDQAALAALMLALAGACAGFLPHNLASPSRIFLGDGGSMPIGFLLAAGAMAIGGAETTGAAALLAAVPLVGLPILDTTLVVVSRRRRGEHVLTGARDHLTHRLRSRLGSARSVAVALAAGQAALCVSGVAMFSLSHDAIFGAAISYVLLGTAALWLLELPVMTSAVTVEAAPAAGSAVIGSAPLVTAAADLHGGAAPKVKVLRIIARLNMGGPAHHVSLLSGLLDPDRYDTLLLHGEVGSGEVSLEEVAKRSGARTATVRGLRPEVRPLDDLRALVALVREMRAFRPDIVHTHTAKAGMLGRLAALVALRPRPVILHTYHGHVLEGYFGRIKSLAYRKTEALLARVSDCLIGVSSATVDDLVRLGIAPRSKFSVVPIGLDLAPFQRLREEDGAPFRAEVGVRPGELLLTFVGRLVAIKRVDVLLHAVARARELGAPVRLAVVGDGEQRPGLEQLAAALGIEDYVSFAGYRADVAAVAAASDIAVLSSDNEGTPVSLIEAAAAGCAAAATCVGGVRDVVTSETGLLVPPGDAAALGAAVATLAADPAARTRMGERAREHAAERFQVDRLLWDADTLYRQLLAPGGLGGGGASSKEPSRAARDALAA